MTFDTKVLYDDLMNLVDSSEAFYFADQELDGITYRIFNYRLASYTEFIRPNGLECRGHMFRMHGTGDTASFAELVSLPMEKFFNLNENPTTMGLDLTQIENVMLKADGSLISSYIHCDISLNLSLRLKSKGSLASDQAVDSMRWLNLSDNTLFHRAVRLLAGSAYTVNMEWCAPHNRIVIGYETAHLVVLNVRNNLTGEYVDMFNDEFMAASVFDPIRENWIEYEHPADLVQFVADIPDMQNIEGYVVQLQSGQHVKVKTGWYMALHHTKDSINSPRRLYEAVLESATDDMRSLFFDDAVAIKMIDEMEQKVEKLYNHLVDQVERFYEANKHLAEMEDATEGKKQYAILGQKELDKKCFGLAMSKYLGHDVDYKDFMKRKWKDFGIKDVEKENA